jgi:hypothetical protein
MTAAGNGTSRRSPWNLYSVEYIKPNRHHPQINQTNNQSKSQPQIQASPTAYPSSPRHPNSPQPLQVPPPNRQAQHFNPARVGDVSGTVHSQSLPIHQPRNSSAWWYCRWWMWATSFGQMSPEQVVRPVGGLWVDGWMMMLARLY